MVFIGFLGWLTFALAIISVLPFIGRHYKIPSESMAPTINAGEFIYSFNLGYNFFGSIRPQRGKLYTLKGGQNNFTYISRLIGLPGDEIQVWNGRLYINGMISSREFVDTYRYKTKYGKIVKVQLYKEDIHHGVSEYFIYETTDKGPLDSTNTFKVPEGHLFFMGDNRDNSADSRISNRGMGYVPIENVIGEVKRVLFSTKPCKADEGLYCPPRRFMQKL